MAATKTHQGDINARTQNKIRASIKAQAIVKALQDHILAGLKMTNTQVRAAEILLRKISPDLLATALVDGTDSALPVLQIVRSPRADSRVSPIEGPSDPPQSKVEPEPDPASPAPARIDAA